MVARPIVRFALPCIACVAVSFLLRADEAKRPAKPKSVFDFDVQTITGEDFSMLEPPEMSRSSSTSRAAAGSPTGSTRAQRALREVQRSPLRDRCLSGEQLRGQEPGTNPEIQQFCAKRDVKFPLSPRSRSRAKTSTRSTRSSRASKLKAKMAAGSAGTSTSSSSVPRAT